MAVQQSVEFLLCAFAFSTLFSVIRAHAGSKQTVMTKKLYVIAAVCALGWLAILVRMDLYNAADSGFSVVIRAAASLAGCIAVSFAAVKGGPLFQKIFSWFGVHSLGIYVSHYMFLNLLNKTL